MPVRLLGVSLPLTVVLGGLAAAALFGLFSLSEALILGVILAPTDARAWERGRHGRETSAGCASVAQRREHLNDGIGVPPLLIVLATVSGAGAESHPLRVLAEEIGYGLLGGVPAGVLAAGGRECRRREASDRRCLAADHSGVRGGARVRDRGRPKRVGVHRRVRGRRAVRRDRPRRRRFDDALRPALDSASFLVFGAVLLGPVFEHVSWQIALYAVLSLTIVRMLPVAISLWGTYARGPTVAFMGWFGPTRACIDRVRSDSRGRTSRSRRNDRRGHLPDRRSLGPPTRALGGAARESLRNLVPSRAPLRWRANQCTSTERGARSRFPAFDRRTPSAWRCYERSPPGPQRRRIDPEA